MKDAKAAETYAPSYEFYAFYRSLSTYQASFENTLDTMVLEPKFEFFKYFSKEE